MAERDYYADLGVQRTATSEEIGHAFRKLAAKDHPDRNPGDASAEARFKTVAEAYNVLKDSKSRAAYDEGGQARVEAETGFRGFDSNEAIFRQFGDVFGDLFGHRVRREAGRGGDYDVELSISFRTAARGARESFAIQAPGTCGACRGSGSSDGQVHACPECRGQGYVSRRARESGGFFSVTQPCARCQGGGMDPAARCSRCQGKGVETRERTIELTIPPAVSEGTILRLQGMGAPGRNGGSPGDLRVHVRVGKEGPFTRDGLDLRCEVALDVLTALLGGRIEAPLLEGSAELSIPAGTQPGQTFRLRGKGLKDGQGREGDLLVTVRVQIPTRLSEAERRIFEQARGESSRRSQ